MKTKMLTILVLALGIILCEAQLSEAVDMGTAFVYQGRLHDAGNPADGIYDFQFELYDDPNDGIQQGSTVAIDELDVINGYFSIELEKNIKHGLSTHRVGRHQSSLKNLLPKLNLKIFW